MNTITIIGTNFPNTSQTTNVCKWQRLYEQSGILNMRIQSYILTNATVLNQSLAICQVPVPEDQEISWFNVEISFNLIDFTHGGLMYHFYAPILVESLNPQFAPTNNSVTINVYGTNFVSHKIMHCWFLNDTFYPAFKIIATYINKQTAECVLPAYPTPGNVNLCFGKIAFF